MARVNLKTQGIKGGNPQYKEKIGLATIFCDSSENLITVDAFQGQGHSYQEREKAQIQIKKGSKMYTFKNFDDLFFHLQKTVK